MAAWRECVDKQGAQHLLTFLALKESGVNTTAKKPHSEQADKSFCERYLYARPGDKPFYDPIIHDFRIHTHYHSNMATARKGTFQASWGAGTMSGARDAEEWILSKDYLKIVGTKIFSKAGRICPIPAMDLAAWLFRSESFDDGATCDTLLTTLKTRFKITDEEFSLLFSSRNLDGSIPSTSDFFTDHKVDNDLLLALLENPHDFDLADSITEIADHKGTAPVKDTDILNLINTGQRNIILQGPPGTGKTRAATRLFGLHNQLITADTPNPDLSEYRLLTEPGQANPHLEARGGWMLVQFHPSYAYDDFIQGITAVIDPETKTPTFQIREGTFIQACRLASTTDKLVFLIIDELNRGDLSKIFGELVYALEYRSKPISLRGGDAATSTLIVPPNLVVIGTMNSADRSIAHIDYAIRRRFSFLTVSPDRSAVESYYSGNRLKKPALLLFDATAKLIGPSPAYAIGHSFFLADSSSQIANNYVFQVMPLLDEYRREGLLDESATIALGAEWPGDSLPIHHDHPFALAQELTAWIESQCQE